MENIEEKKYWIWFSKIKSINVKNKIKLLQEFKTPRNIYYLRKKKLENCVFLKEFQIEELINVKIENSVEKNIEYMIKNKIDIISICDKEYPSILKNIYDPPISLYVKGNKKVLSNNSIAIVGCRDASNYGKEVAKYFAYNLSKRNVNIVSGLAKGIDSFAHFGTICAKGNTIAVVGNGLHTVYPKENTRLANDILQNDGLIISEYPIGTNPAKINFPERNRIISGLSKAIIIVEAKKKSGALITVDLALEQGRDVFSVPGEIDSVNSIGTNKLIKSGAKLITSYKDII